MAIEYDEMLLQNGISYENYLKQLGTEISNPSAEEATQKLLPYTLRNLEIMKELGQEVIISEAFKEAVKNAPNTEWLVITEGWCGDAAFILPVLAAAERSLPRKLKLHIYFRDQNPKLMDTHLTNGGRSIPKLIILDDKLNFLNSWGPRPKKLQKEIDLWKEQGLELKELILKVRDWYQQDCTQTIQEELTLFFAEINSFQST